MIADDGHKETEDGEIKQGDNYYDFSFVGEPKNGAISFSIGTTKRIVYPLWFYVGAGLSYSRTTQNCTVGPYDFKYTIVRYGTQHWRPNVEAGLIVELKSIYLSAGLRSDFSDTYFTAGIGFTLH
jgi:hypothetical protein